MNRLQEIRHECLLQLYGAMSVPISAAHIAKVARRGGFDYAAQEIRDALYFLEGQKFADKQTDPATGEIRHVITSAGILNWEGRSS
jgi:repressor of nif and glnA expression